jgi:hypothetical protein
MLRFGSVLMVLLRSTRGEREPGTIGCASFSLIAPEVLKPIRRQLRVPHGVGDVPVTEIGLQRAGVVAAIGQRIAASVPQHVGGCALMSRSAASAARSTR